MKIAWSPIALVYFIDLPRGAKKTPRPAGRGGAGRISSPRGAGRGKIFGQQALDKTGLKTDKHWVKMGFAQNSLELNLPILEAKFHKFSAFGRI